MAKQKIVVKVTMENDKKRSKAMMIAATVSGVDSVAFVGADKEEIAVTGEGIDSIELTRQLRKNVGHTSLISVGEVKEEKPAEASGDPKENKESQPRFEYVYPPPYHPQIMPFQVVHEVPDSFCSIL